MASENNLEFANQELEAEEVNVYAENCGALRACQTDCHDGSCFFTCIY